MRIYLHFLLFFIGFCLYGQNIDLKWSEEFKKKSQVEIIGTNDANIYGYYLHSDDLVLKKFNSNAKLVKEQIVEVPISTKKYDILNSFILNNFIHFFIVERNRKEDKFTLLLVKMDLSFKVEKKVLILDEASDRLSADETFKINLSPDSSKCFIYHSEVKKRNAPEEYSIKVFNSKFEKVEWEKKIELPYKDKDFSIEQFAVDNLGNIYCLSKIDIPKKERTKDGDVYYFNLISYQNLSGKPTELEVNFEKSHIVSVKILPGEQNTLVCTGFYDDLKSNIFGKYDDDVSNGFFSFIIDCKTLTIKSKSNQKIEGLYPKKIKYKDRIPYLVRKFYSTENGGYILLAEQYQLVVRTYTDSRGHTSTSYTYYYGDIVTIEIDPKNIVKSVTRISKYQLNSNQPSISSCFLENKLFVFYIDLVKNLKIFEDEDLNTQRSGFFSDKNVCLTMATIDFKGKPKKEMIFSCKELDIYPDIKNAINVNNASLVFKSSNQIGILSLK